MHVFLSWSGDMSNAIAKAFYEWLPIVLQRVEPYFTTEDIAKGQRWRDEISAMLDSCQMGIMILTPSNLQSPWMLFEAGALAKSVDQSRIIPILFGLKPTDIEDPLSMFQLATEFSKEEMRRVVESVNQQMGDDRLTTERLERAFEVSWPNFERDVADAQKHQQDKPQHTRRSTPEMVEELLELARLNSRLLSSAPWSIPRPRIDTPDEAIERPAFGTVQREIYLANGTRLIAGDTYFKDNKPFGVFLGAQNRDIMFRMADDGQITLIRVGSELLNSLQSQPRFEADKSK